jgi:FlaA1/EpsC-like NDP-sugar epimerase
VQRLLPIVKDYFNSKQCSSLILAVMTHGDDGGILYGDDGEPVNVKDIIEVLQQLPYYKGKPKMLVIQACRGGK